MSNAKTTTPERSLTHAQVEAVMERLGESARRAESGIEKSEYKRGLSDAYRNAIHIICSTQIEKGAHP